MYNQERKERYINYVKNDLGTKMSVGYLETKFKNTETYETEYGKDLCDFTAYEIVDMYNRLGLRSLDTYIVMNSLLSLYTDWCLRENLVKDHINHYRAEINADVLNGCVNKGLIYQQILTREEVLGYCEELENPCDQFTILAIFEGISGFQYGDLLNLKMSDIRFEDGKYIAHLQSDRDIVVSSQLHSYASLSNEALEVDSFPKEGVKPRILKLVENGRILKKNTLQKIDDEEHYAKSLYVRLKKIFSYLGMPYMRGNLLYESGRIAHIKEEAARYQMTPREYLYSPQAKETWELFPPEQQVVGYLRKFGEVLG